MDFSIVLVLISNFQKELTIYQLYTDPIIVYSLKCRYHKIILYFVYGCIYSLDWTTGPYFWFLHMLWLV